MPVEVTKVKQLFLAALEMPAHQRAAYLESACAGDAVLRQRLEDMLQSHDYSGELLPRSPAEMLADGAATEADGTAAWARGSEASATQGERAESEPDGLPFLAPSAKPGNLGRLGHYEVQEVIGKGGFGIVLRAFDEKLHRVVAIKVLSPAYATTGSARERFIREARAAAAVKNEQVVAIYNVQDEEQPPYLVMELIDGVTLQEKLEKKGPLSVKEILRIGMQTAEGLAAAHKQGLVHRDVKPANILLENGVERVKLTDFGLARAVDDASLSQSGTVAGTPMYMSPEQAEGLAVDARSDLFSLGSVLYAMCTGHSPFRAGGTHAVLKRVIEASPRPVREVNPEIPAWLTNVIAKLHAKEPGERFQTAQEVADLLGQYLAHVQQPATVPAPALPAAALGSPASGQPVSVPADRFWWLVSRVIQFGALFAFLFWLFDLVIRLVLRPGFWHESWTMLAALFGACLGFAVFALIRAVQARQHRAILVIEGLVLAGAALAVVLVASFLAPSLRPSVPASPDSGNHDNARVHPAPEGPGWVQLFNGKDLTGWTSLRGPRSRWKVTAGAITCSGQLDNLYTERDFGNFHLWAECKINAEGNSGIYFRAGKPLVKVGDYEAQITNDPGQAYKTGSLYGLVIITKLLVPPDTWFTYEIIARGKLIRILVNGKETANFTESRPDRRTTGHIALQHHDDSTHVSFRQIAIKNLNPPTDPGWGRSVNGTIAALAVSPNGKLVAVGRRPPQGPNPNFDGLLLDRATGSELHRLKGPTRGTGVSAFAFSPDSKRVAGCGGGSDRKAYLWDTATGALLHTLVGHKEHVSGITFSAGGEYLLSASWDRTLRLWDARTGMEIPLLAGDPKVPAVDWSRVLFLPQRMQAVVGGLDKLALVEICPPAPKAAARWGIQLVREFAWPGGRVNGLSLSRDGQRLLTSVADRGDGRVCLWDVNTGQLVRAFDTPIPPKFWWFDVAFLPDGKRFLTTGASKAPLGESSPTSLALWDAESGKVLQLFQGHTDTVIAIAATPDGEHAVSGGLDKTVRMWKLP